MEQAAEDDNDTSLDYRLASIADMTSTVVGIEEAIGVPGQMHHTV